MTTREEAVEAPAAAPSAAARLAAPEKSQTAECVRQYTSISTHIPRAGSRTEHAHEAGEERARAALRLARRRSGCRRLRALRLRIGSHQHCEAVRQPGEEEETAIQHDDAL